MLRKTLAAAYVLSWTIVLGLFVHLAACFLTDVHKWRVRDSYVYDTPWYIWPVGCLAGAWLGRRSVTWHRFHYAYLLSCLIAVVPCSTSAVHYWVRARSTDSPLHVLDYSLSALFFTALSIACGGGMLGSAAIITRSRLPMA